MQKLKTDEQYKWGQKNIIPVVGEVSISDEGIIEVESLEIAKEIEACDIGFHIVGKQSSTTTTSTTSTTSTTTIDPIKSKVDEDKLNNKGEDSLEGEEDEKNELLKSFDTKTYAELKELAKPFPGSEWRSLNKEGLIGYLKSKL